MIEITYGEHLSERLLTTGYSYDAITSWLFYVFERKNSFIRSVTPSPVTRGGRMSHNHPYSPQILCVAKYRNLFITMIGSTLARASRPVVVRQQRRGFLNWMVNYPDKVSTIFFFTTSPRSGVNKRTAAYIMADGYADHRYQEYVFIIVKIMGR